MTIELEYSELTEDINITFDGAFIIKAINDGSNIKFVHLEKVNDEALEKVIEILCRGVFDVLG